MLLHPFIHSPKEFEFVWESRVRPLSFDWTKVESLNAFAS
jgi:hypothetical protein